MKIYLYNNFDYSKLPEYFDELPLWSAPFGLKMLEYIDYKKNITVLDIGFGTGFPLTEIALRLGNSCKIYGIDPWTEAIERAKRKIEFYQIHNIEIIQGEAENIPIMDKSIELITSNNGINNVNDIDKVLSECSRIMKSGGQFIQTMNLEKTMFEFYEQFEQVLFEMKMNEEIEKMHKHIHKKRMPLDKYIPTIEKHGFNIMNVEYDSFNYKFTDAASMFGHYFFRLAFIDSWKILLPENKQEIIFDEIEKRLNEQAKLNGFINLTIPFALINAERK